MKYQNAILGACFALFLPVAYIVLQMACLLAIHSEKILKTTVSALCTFGSSLIGM